MSGPDRIRQVEVSAYTVPTDAPEADGTFSWSETTMVLVQVHSDDLVGTGWTYGAGATAALVRETLAPLVVGRSALEVVGAWSAMVARLRNIGRPGIGSMALSAVDCALWDLKARALGVPLHRLLGAARSAVPLYGSGGFTSYDDDQLACQLRRWTEGEGMSRVKIKIGESWGGNESRDLDRVRQARQLIGDDVELYVDANGGYNVGQAVRVASTLDALDVGWFEEPVSSDDLDGLRSVRGRTRADVAAGEYGYDLVYFQRLCSAGALDCVQVDVSRCGGITELLRIAAVAAAYNLDISGHCAPYLHAPVLAAVPNLRHLEWFHDHVRIERQFFAGATAPDHGSLALSDDVVGNGLTWLPEVAESFRVR
ncbi:enolase C-terminal domain-like protein [Microlunatus panaciterrae]|uniref:L-alanine-DL-glutamate epimerase-like enolase superfamily enzyme n=1 Tax=Microlunatus panaciterrae TaxID=400768 RepID=A0ABS2RME9_9ACTN|nr:enolase C-terminal domain-like protein [Microlunatus panaciterrae]MBM7799114.1 L-alanine-DL-glutamate epimerase-like enolase superfamily enzyme [Microlunatus panaciterrae]